MVLGFDFLGFQAIKHFPTKNGLFLHVMQCTITNNSFLLVFYWYVLVFYPYVTGICISYVLVCCSCVPVCTRMLLVCTRVLPVCYWYMYLVRTRMLLVSTRMYSYVTRMYSCGVLVTIGETWIGVGIHELLPVHGLYKY